MDPRIGKSWKRIKNEEKLIDAGRQEFAQYGFHGATIDRIAERAGMPKPNARYYFKTKKELYLIILDLQIDDWLSSLSAIDAGGEPAKEVKKYIIAKLDQSLDNPEGTHIFTSEILSGAAMFGERLYDKEDIMEVVAIIRRWVKEGRLARIDPIQLMFVIWATTAYYADFQPIIRAFMNTDELTPSHLRKIRKSLCDIILYGIVPRQ